MEVLRASKHERGRKSYGAQHLPAKHLPLEGQCDAGESVICIYTVFKPLNVRRHAFSARCVATSGAIRESRDRQQREDHVFQHAINLPRN